METQYYLQTLRRLVQLSEECQYSSVEEHEPAFFAVLMYILNANDELQNQAEQEFIRMIEAKKSQPHHIIGYCVRKLQFPGLKEKVMSLSMEAYEKNDHRLAAVLSNLLKDYDLGFGDPEELYSYYRNKSSL